MMCRSCDFKKCAAFLLLLRLSALLLTLSVSVFFPISVDASQVFDVRFDLGEWIFLEGIAGSPTAETEPAFIHASAGRLLYPGACGILRVKMVNDGKHTAKLLLSDGALLTDAPLQIVFSGIPSGNEPISLAPGEDCFLYVTVRWDPESTDADVDVDGSFAITLSCEEGEVVIGGPPEAFRKREIPPSHGRSPLRWVLLWRFYCFGS